MEEKTRQRIIIAASELFNQRGYRTVTLDDIANSLGMSKKTIYSCFAGKEEIADAVVNEHSKLVLGRIREIRESDQDPIEKISEIINAVKVMRKQVNPQFLEDIQKYAPVLWNKIECQKEDRTMLMEVLIRDGQEKGMIKDIDPRLVVMFYLSVINYLIRPDLLIKHGFTVEEILDSFREIYLNGIHTERT